MRTRHWNSVCTAALLTGGVVLAPTGASAAPPRTVEGSDLTLLCVGAGAAGSVELALDVSVDASGERTGGFLNVSEPDGDLSSVSEEGKGTVLYGGAVLSGNFPMLDATTNQPVGNASFSVDVASAGEPTTTTDRTRTGNAWRSVTA